MSIQGTSRPLFLTVSLVLCFLLFPDEVRACKCVRSPLDDALKSAHAVFSGKVVSIKYLDDPKQRNPEPRTIVTFKVSRSWKGAETKEFVLHTIDNSWTCAGYYFREGKGYLVFAYRNNAESAKRFEPDKLPEISFGLSLCGGTKLLTEGETDLKILGEGKIPE